MTLCKGNNCWFEGNYKKGYCKSHYKNPDKELTQKEVIEKLELFEESGLK